jgi:hypothetical protein
MQRLSVQGGASSRWNMYNLTPAGYDCVQCCGAINLAGKGAGDWDFEVRGWGPPWWLAGCCMLCRSGRIEMQLL